MKRIGIIGGLGPEATIEYYRIIVEEYRKRTEGIFPEVLMYSLSMTGFGCMLKPDRWPEVTTWLVKAIEALACAGADFALIASNTPHVVFADVEKRVSIPMLNIVTETCSIARKRNLKRCALLGTKTTMTATFYRSVFEDDGIQIIVPEPSEQDYIQKKLVQEILFKKIKEKTRQGLLMIIKRLIDQEAIDGVVLGCTELPLILPGDEYGIPFLNTTRIHAEAAVAFSLK